MASGKSAVANRLIETYGFKKVSSSVYLREIALQRGREADRTGLQELGDQLDIETDYKWIVDPVTIGAAASNSSDSPLLVDAVRKRRQVEHFRSQFQWVRHVHIFAPEQVLRDRYIDRELNSESGDRDAVLKQYERSTAHPNEEQARALIDIADDGFDTSELSTESIAEIIAKLGGV